MFRKLCVAGVLAMVLAAGAHTTTPAYAQADVKAGVLTCDVSSGWGFIFGSSRDLECNSSEEAKTDEHYEGAVTKVGSDIGYYQAGVMPG